MVQNFSRKKVLLYIAFSYGVTWILWIPLFLNYSYNLNVFTLPGQFYLASFGPLTSVIVTLMILEGKKGVYSWFSRTYSCTFPKKWLLLAIAMPLCYGIVGILAHRFMLGEWLKLSSFGLTSKLPGFNLWQTAVVWVATFGLGEESGWRGFLLPELTKKYSLRVSSLIVSAIWIFWHFTAFFFNSTYVNMGLGIIGWAISLTFGSVLLA